MTTSTSADAVARNTIDGLVDRARSLYTLPAVAAEVIELTSNPKVDTRALRDCIQTDPALTAKLLRVVNSSLFGLSREVCDLNQALALLGTKPLKLLVLGFSLPESLFAEVAKEQFDWYWSSTLTRAVAAREISEQLFRRPGDDAFLAGLFQDIGVLVLLGELREAYAGFLSTVIELNADLKRLETDALDFDHLQLTAKLLEHWQMPKLLVNSIAEPRETATLLKGDDDYRVLARILHLAELLAELVGQNRLSVLPDLLETGAAYCELDKDRLNELVEGLQPKVQQLAQVLSLELVSERDYSQILTAAHQRMSELTEEVVTLLGHPPLEEEEAYRDLLQEASHLRGAVDHFLSRTASDSQPAVESDLDAKPRKSLQRIAGAKEATAVESSSPAAVASAAGDFLKELTLLVGHCRSRRQPVSVILLEIGGLSSSDAVGRQLVDQMLTRATAKVYEPEMLIDASNRCRRVLVLPNLERQEAVRLAEELLTEIDKMSEWLAAKGTSLKYLPGAGVSSVSLPPKNFPPQDLLDTAKRCLSAAQSSGSNVVKSLEIY